MLDSSTQNCLQELHILSSYTDTVTVFFNPFLYTSHFHTQPFGTICASFKMRKYTLAHTHTV